MIPEVHECLCTPKSCSLTPDLHASFACRVAEHFGPPRDVILEVFLCSASIEFLNEKCLTYHAASLVSELKKLYAVKGGLLQLLVSTIQENMAKIHLYPILFFCSVARQCF